MSTTPDEPAWDDDLDDLNATSAALWEGDEGTIDDRAVRTAIVVLLKNRYVSARTNPAEWVAISANPRTVRAQLNNLYCDLVLDTEREVAFKRPIGGGMPTLLHDTAWNREETILLVWLRARLRTEQANAASRAFVDKADMLEALAAYRPTSATDRVADTRRANNAIGSLITADLLLGRSDADRFEISPAIATLLPLDTLTELLSWLRLQTGQHEHADTTSEDD